MARCLRQPTLATWAAGQEIVCTVAVYEWLLDHPDRVALAWQRLEVPALTIGRIDDDTFFWSDGQGNHITWRAVAKQADRRVWYASGKLKATRLTPPIAVEAVAILHYPKLAEKDGVARYRPQVECYLRSESRTALMWLRLLGPAADQMASQAAGQLIDFFSGIAEFVQQHPQAASVLLAPPRR